MPRRGAGTIANIPTTSRENFVNTATADLSDAHPQAQILEPLFHDFGGLRSFHGPLVTLKVFEDNALVRTLLEEPGAGRVLVIDGGDPGAVPWSAETWRSSASRTAGGASSSSAAFGIRRRFAIFRSV